MTKFRGNPWAVLVAVSLGFFMTLLDLTIVNIAIPDMITRLHASLDDVLWVINAYALVLAVVLITAGRLGDLIGQRVMFIIGIALFTAASAACGLAPGPGWLIAFRAIQGLGAAVLMPQTLAILTMVFPPERRGAAFGVWSAVGGVATIAGPTLGGLLVTTFDWRYIFFVNLPIGAAVITLAVAVIPDLHARRKHRLDLAGVVLASAALLGICYGLVEGQRYHWGTVRSFLGIPLVIGTGVTLLGLFVLVQAMRQDREPLIPFALFKDRNYTLMNWVAVTVMIGMLGVFLTFTIYLQSVLGFSALKAGLTLAPASVLVLVAAPAAGRLSDRIGGKYILITGLVLFAAGMGWAALIATPSSAWYDFLPSFLVAGAGMGCVFPPMTTVAMRDIEPPVAGAASGLLNTNRQVGSVIGAAAVGALLQNRLAIALPRQARQRSVGLPAPIRDKLVAGVTRAANSGAVGSGQSTSFHPQHGIPAQLASHVAQIYQASFTHGYVDAMRPTIALPIAVLAVAALSCLAIKGGPVQPAQAGTEEAIKAPTAAA
ncbi:MAG TPA: DHA2 family efflux MFS transporter permease subunit [Streptosporangiaceae bacterium]|nr:DHA2 family efflux MFS transporter permease subunit [Streptosporangiaceae bacterium]